MAYFSKYLCKKPIPSDMIFLKAVLPRLYSICRTLRLAITEKPL